MLGKLMKKQKGFTLIEIVIVLAIAGLIMVVVFLAVQGAQRGRRDNERKQATARLLAAAEQAASNNNGTYVAGCPAGYNAGGFPCSTASASLEQVWYRSGQDCAGTANTRFIRADVTLETGAVNYCEDNN